MKDLAKYSRYLWEEENLLIVMGQLSPVIAGMKAYNARYGILDSDSESLPQIERLLGATGLAALSLAERESWGWTITLPGSSVGFFVGVEPEGMICCRVREVDPGHPSVAVQRQKADKPLTQSLFEPPDGDPVNVVHGFFKEVEQTRTRLVVCEDGQNLLVQALPGGRFEKVTSLDDGDLVELISKKATGGELKPLNEVLLFYECRCHDEMILDMIDKLPKNRQCELWGNLRELEIECPRCGRMYVVKKNTLTHQDA